ncbi:MAG: DUF7009 family protein [Pyrinomonadaceae bacterium]
MKLRIRGNSIRLRLSQGEVERFAADGVVEDSTQFGESSLRYALEASDAAGEIFAGFTNGRICVTVPRKTALEWAAGDAVGIGSNDAVPRVLVEKDFVCLSPRQGEDESDMFPNPAGKSC